MMNIIFLDIDGVLNSERLADRLVSQGYTEANYDFIDLNELTRLIYFINKYNIKFISLTSELFWECVNLVKMRKLEELKKYQEQFNKL